MDGNIGSLGFCDYNFPLKGCKNDPQPFDLFRKSVDASERTSVSLPI